MALKIALKTRKPCRQGRVFLCTQSWQYWHLIQMHRTIFKECKIIHFFPKIIIKKYTLDFWKKILFFCIHTLLAFGGKCSGGFRGEHPRRTPPPPTAQKFLNFMQFFAKFGKIICWHPPWRIGAPNGESWIRPWNGFPVLSLNILWKYAFELDANFAYFVYMGKLECRSKNFITIYVEFLIESNLIEKVFNNYIFSAFSFSHI